MNESLHRGVVIPVRSVTVFTAVSASSLFAFFLNFPLFCHTIFVPNFSVFPITVLLFTVHCNQHGQMSPIMICFSYLIKQAGNVLGSHVMNITNIKCTFDYVISKLHT